MLKGGFNHSLMKFIELSLAIDRVPNIQLASFEDYLARMKEKTVSKSTPIILQLNSSRTLSSDIFAEETLYHTKRKTIITQLAEA